MFFTCPFQDCQQVFSSRKILNEHSRTHSAGRPYQCLDCDQSFTQYSSLQKHARVHDKLKPFICNFQGCDKAFSQISNLIRHKRIHNGEKPYVCDVCFKKFASGSNLKQHKLIHEQTVSRQAFTCIFPECQGKQYLYQSSLKKHYNQSHAEEYEEHLEKLGIINSGQIQSSKKQKESREPFQKEPTTKIRDQVQVNQTLSSSPQNPEMNLSKVSKIRQETQKKSKSFKLLGKHKQKQQETNYDREFIRDQPIGNYLMNESRPPIQPQLSDSLGQLPILLPFLQNMINQNLELIQKQLFVNQNPLKKQVVVIQNNKEGEQNFESQPKLQQSYFTEKSTGLPYQNNFFGSNYFMPNTGRISGVSSTTTDTGFNSEQDSISRFSRNQNWPYFHNQQEPLVNNFTSNSIFKPQLNHSPLVDKQLSGNSLLPGFQLRK